MLTYAAYVALSAALLVTAPACLAQTQSAEPQTQTETTATPPSATAAPNTKVEASPRSLTTRPGGSNRWRTADELEAAKAAQANLYELPTGTRIPLGLINSVSTRTAAPGDRVYLETVFPITADGKVVIPPGSHVLGTVTAAKRPGRMKGKGELHIRFDSLILPNGVTRDFRARVGGLDGGLREGLDREEGAIKGDSSKGQDIGTVVGTTVTGASLGTLGGLAAGNAGRGAGIGLGAGAAAGLAGVLLTRGPDVMLPAGSTVELVTDRPLTFEDADLRFEGGTGRSIIRTNQPTTNQQTNSPWGGRTGIPY